MGTIDPSGLSGSYRTRWHRADRVVAALLGIAALECGSTGSERLRATVPPSAATTARLERADEVALTPLLPRAALDARVQAQRSVLGGREPLVEDERGTPLAWISGQSTSADDMSMFDEELLNSLPGSSGLGGDTTFTGARVNGNMLGLYEPLGGDTASLRHFYDALRRLRGNPQAGAKVRIVVYGASHTEADIFPHYLRSYLRERFGDGGHGFVQLAQPWRGYSQTEVSVEGFDHWQTDHAQRRNGRNDGLFGLLGASIATTSKRAWGKVTPEAQAVGSQYEILYVQQPNGGRFQLWVDGNRQATINTRSLEFAPGYHHFSVPEAPHVVEVHPLGDGEVRLLGMVSERDQPGIVVDTLGIRGSRAASMLRWDETIWADNLRHRNPDLYVLAYGTNEAVDADRSIESYEEKLRAVLARFAAAAPQASCLLVGPGDFPLTSDDGRVDARPRVGEIIATQERVATDMGCAFWDLRAFMGGELSMVRWVHSIPPMASSDHIHLTRRGYTRMGMALTDALMMPFDQNDPLRLGSTPSESQ